MLAPEESISTVLRIDIDEGSWSAPTTVSECKKVVVSIKNAASVRKHALILRYFLRMQRYKNQVKKVTIETTEAIVKSITPYERLCPVEIEYKLN